MIEPQNGPQVAGDHTGSPYSLENIRRQATEARIQEDLESGAKQTYWRRQRALDQAITRDMRTILSPPARYFRSDRTPLTSALFLALLATGVAALFPTLLESGSVFIAFMVGGFCGWCGHALIATSPTVREIPYLLLHEYGIKRFRIAQAQQRAPWITHSSFTLVGGWTGLTENGNDPQAVETLPTLSVPVRTDKIAADLTHTRAALEAMRAE